SGLRQQPEDAGSQVRELQLIAIPTPHSYESLDRLIDELHDYQSLIFTSTNGVRSFFDRLRFHGKDARALGLVMVAAVCESTADELRAHGIEPDLVPPKFQSAALLPLLEGD